MNSWEKFATAFEKLRVSSRSTYKSGKAPHKPCMLLAVIESIEQGDFSDNEIRYEPILLERFEKYFKVVHTKTSNRNTRSEIRAYYPFVYLDNEDFWNLHNSNKSILFLSGSERNDIATKGVRSVLERVEFASLDEELFKFMQNSEIRQLLRDVIIKEWFPEHQEQFWRAVNDAKEQKKFEQEFYKESIETLVDQEELGTFANWRRINNLRDSNFRKLVLRAYNFRCAATGWQLKTKNGESLLEAAHIMPLANRKDNRPQNGIALLPTIHRAMDRDLIAPGPDYKWYASKYLKDAARIDEGAKWLWSLHGEPVHVPENTRLQPSENSLQWRMEQLVD